MGYSRSSLRDFLWTAPVGEVISTVALADQISREFNVSDQGIDMEMEHEIQSSKTEIRRNSEIQNPKLCALVPHRLALPPGAGGDVFGIRISGLLRVSGIRISEFSYWMAQFMGWRASHPMGEALRLDVQRSSMCGWGRISATTQGVCARDEPNSLRKTCRSPQPASASPLYLPNSF
ncbi:MAG: hypothetical protein AAB676_19075 [Verrucomicrobiota bacterium]